MPGFETGAWIASPDLAGLADGMFAFALTLIIFEIGVPNPATITSDAQLWTALVGLEGR